ASPPDSELVSSEVMEIVIPEVGRIDDDIPLTIKDDNLHDKLLNVNLLIATIEALDNNPTPSSDCKIKSSSTSLNSFLEETNTFHNSLSEFENFYFDLGEISSGSTTTHSDISLPDYEAFYFDNDHIKGISSGSPTTQSDISLSEYDAFIFNLTHEEFVDELAQIISPSEYDCFYFRDLPDQGELMSVLNSGIRENFSTTSENLPIEDDHSPLLAYVVWIFVAYLTYPVIPPYLYPFGNEDTIFDPGITINHFYLFKPGLSHRHGAFKKFNTHRSHLNEWPMTINGKNTHILDVLLIPGNLKTLAKGFYPPSLNFFSFNWESYDVTRLQALVDRKKIVISEDVIREILQLDDAEGVVRLPNEEIFAGLAQLGYEKPSTKLTFYKAFFSSQWKFLIHTLLQSLSAKRTFWNEFSTTMASAENVTEDVTNNAIPSPPSHDIPSPSQAQSSPPQQPQSSPQAPPQGADFPTHFQEVLDTRSALTRRVENLEHDKAAQKLEIIKLKAMVKRLERANKVKSSKIRRLRKVGASRRIESSDDMEDVFNQERMIDDLDKDEGIELVKDADIAETKVRHVAEQAEKQAKIYHLDLDHPSKVLSIQEDDSKVQEVVEVVTTAKIITDVVTSASQVSAASATISAAKPSFPAAAPTVVAAYTRRRKGVIIRDPEEELSSKTPAETPKLKDKGKAKRRKLNEEAQEAEDLKKHLEVVDDEDDDVFIEASPLARKVPVVDYQIVLIDNRPRFKIIKVDETHQLYISFITLLKNFDREDLENLWGIVKERFSTSKPTNFSDEYPLLILKTRFEKPNGQDAVWKSQRNVHGLALEKVRSC
nr:hypothetical protein [Tanacetum cinerariifolium]